MNRPSKNQIWLLRCGTYKWILKTGHDLGVDWLRLAQKKVSQRCFVNMVMTLRVP